MGYVLKIQPFCLNDGPGLRTTVFLQGCNLRCFWCHNPESQPMKPVPMLNPALCIGCGACADACPQAPEGKTAIFTDACIGCGSCCRECFTGAREMSSWEMSSAALMEQLLRQKSLFQQSGGGVTFSGGEPLMQPDFLTEMLHLCTGAGIHTAVDSALHVPFSKIEPLLPFAGLWLCDLKAIDPQKHRRGTGMDNGIILDNIRSLLEQNARIILRMPIIPGFNDSESDIRGVCDFLHTLPRIPPVNLLPFHNWCSNKYHLLGQTYAADSIAPPSEEHMNSLRHIFLREHIADVTLNG